MTTETTIETLTGDVLTLPATTYWIRATGGWVSTTGDALLVRDDDGQTRVGRCIWCWDAGLDTMLLGLDDDWHNAVSAPCPRRDHARHGGSW